VSSAFHIRHEDDRVEIVDDLGEAILALVETYRNEEWGEVRWSS